MIKVVLNNGQTLSHPRWSEYDTDHKGELDLTAPGSDDYVATFNVSVWRYVYDSDFQPVVENPAPPQPYTPF